MSLIGITAHELSDAAVAKANGLPVKAITLFALGGVAQIEKEAEDAKSEFWMGIVGPIASAIIGFACLGLVMALGWTPSVAPQTPLTAMLIWLGVINIVLAIFNMIPRLSYGRWAGASRHRLVGYGPVIDSRNNLQTFVDKHLPLFAYFTQITGKKAFRLFAEKFASLQSVC